MPVATRITPLENTIKLLLDSRLSPKARSKRVADFASVRIAAADEQNRRALGAVPPKTITVDGKQGAPLESVNPDHGIIIAEWALVGEVLQWIGERLRERSPVVSGRYRNTHKLYADNQEVDWNKPPLAAEYIFLNPLAYSRKLEVGKTESGRDFLVSVPNRIYERTAKDAQSRFGNIAKVRFIYSAAVGGSIAKRHAKTDRVPAILVTLR
jgi:hypothetical protein